MTNEEILQAGIQALKSGDRGRAGSLLAQVVKADPGSEQGWYWLGMACSAADQREYCLRRALAINPGNADARRQLAGMGKSAPAAPPSASPSWTEQRPPVSQPTPAPTPPPSYYSSPPEPKSAFSYYNDDEEEPAGPIQGEVRQPYVPPTIPGIEQPKAPARPVQRKKKSNTRLILALMFGTTLVGCILGIPLYLAVASSTGFALFPTKAPTSTRPPFLVPFTATPLPPTTIPTRKPTVAYTPLFENATCPFDEPWGAVVRCGYLVVPEDRTGDPNHTIRLAVAIFTSQSATPAEPLIFLQGGPGADAVQLAADAYDFLVAPFTPKRDFIIFDQRGTGYSTPALGCDEVTKLYNQDIRGAIHHSTRELVYSNAFLSCNGLMQAQGVNLNAYTTVESAADIKDLVTVLGYQKVDLFGASYGTRLAQVMMRDYPEIVNSAILDSVVPVDTSLFSHYPDAVGSGLRNLFINCAIDPECGTAYPNLEVVFWDLVKKLDANPVTVTTSDYPTGTLTETVTGTTVMNIVLGSIKYSPQMIATAPQTIYRFNSGDFSTLVMAQSSMPYMFEGMSPGLFISMMCHEHVLAASPAELQAAQERQIIRDYAWLPFYGDVNDVYKTCASWGSTGPWIGENDAVVSDIPSLIMTGSYDPTTPPMYAKQIAGQLSHSYYFEFPNLAHTPSFTDDTGCGMDTVLAFLDNPTVEPDRSCMDDSQKIDFVVPYTGNPPLELESVRAYGITVDVPKDWYSLGAGFYFRGNSPLDITEVAVFPIPASSAEIQEWFSLEAYGYRGLDSALIPSGTRQANGLMWTLLTSSSYGRPVDFAMADYRGQTILIALFSNSDEHDALYRTVFLPMIDSASP
ncbi:MAG: alpha/beta fold hydrolase [Chloroflexota bacterium]